MVLPFFRRCFYHNLHYLTPYLVDNCKKGKKFYAGAGLRVCGHRGPCQFAADTYNSKADGVCSGFKNYEIVTRGSQLQLWPDPSQLLAMHQPEVASMSGTSAMSRHRPSASSLPWRASGLPIQRWALYCWKVKAVASTVANHGWNPSRAAGLADNGDGTVAAGDHLGQTAGLGAGKASGRCQHRSRSPGPVWR